MPVLKYLSGALTLLTDLLSSLSGFVSPSCANTVSRSTERGDFWNLDPHCVYASYGRVLIIALDEILLALALTGSDAYLMTVTGTLWRGKLPLSSR